MPMACMKSVEKHSYSSNEELYGVPRCVDAQKPIVKVRSIYFVIVEF